MEHATGNLKAEIARFDRLAKLCRRRAWLCGVKLWCLWPLEAMGFRWAQRAATNLGDERAELLYAQEEHAQNAGRQRRLAMRLAMRTLPNFEGTLQEALEDCRCRTWEDAMKATVAGAVDYDDWQELVFRCGEVADQSAYERQDGMPWSEAAGVALDWVLGAGEGSEFQAEQAQDLIQCGRIADWVARDLVG